MEKGMGKLAEFYASLKIESPVYCFLASYDKIFPFIHTTGLTKDYRLAKNEMKKLCDEVTPVARFVRAHAEPDDGIWFALDDSAPDCHLRQKGGRLRGIEVTVAGAQERLHVMRELNETGMGRGYIGLPDDAPTEAFRKRMAEPRIAYCAEEISRSLIAGVELCARKKGKFQGDILLIEAPLHTLPADRWNQFRPQLAEKVKGLAFNEVYVTGGIGKKGVCLRIK